MKNLKAILAAAFAVALVVGGVWAFAQRDNNQPNDNQAAVNLSSVEIPKSETEKMLEGFSGDEYDRFYVANMIAHHQGAVDMARLAQSNAKRGELKSMASNIISAQTTEINNLLSWQKAWGYPSSSREMMEDHSAMATMGDMEASMEELKNKSGDDFDKTFLRLMIAHHESAVAMSRPGIKNAQHQEVKDLAKAVIEAQTSEIAQMRQWQVKWGFES